MILMINLCSCGKEVFQILSPLFCHRFISPDNNTARLSVRFLTHNGYWYWQEGISFVCLHRKGPLGITLRLCVIYGDVVQRISFCQDVKLRCKNFIPLPSCLPEEYVMNCKKLFTSKRGQNNTSHCLCNTKLF